MSSEYTPTTESIREYYGLGRYEFSPGEDTDHPNEFYQEFADWYAAELRKARVEALREAAEALSRQPSTCKSPGCHRADRIILESRADREEDAR